MVVDRRRDEEELVVRERNLSMVDNRREGRQWYQGNEGADEDNTRLTLSYQYSVQATSFLSLSQEGSDTLDLAEAQFNDYDELQSLYSFQGL